MTKFTEPFVENSSLLRRGFKGQHLSECTEEENMAAVQSNFLLLGIGMLAGD